MKSFNFILAAVLIPMMVLFTGCTTEEIRNIKDAPVATSSKGVSMAKVTKAIKDAGVSMGWSMRLIKPGHFEGTLYLRKHMARVAVDYSANSYSINYVDSKNLNHDGNMIHKNYNGWIINLDSAIKQRLSIL